MSRLLTIVRKGAWRAAVASCAIAACPGAYAEDGVVPAGAAAPAVDQSELYRNAYRNPASVCPPEMSRTGAPERPVSGSWQNLRRYRIYGGADYIKYYRSNEPRLALTRTSRDLFWDDPVQQAQGALNAENGRAVAGVVPAVQLFPARQVPFPNLQAPLFTPNDADARVNVNETLVPGQERLSTSDFDFNRGLDGVRPKIGLELPNGDRVEFRYFWTKDFSPPQIVDNVAGAGFFTKVINTQNPVLFAIFRFGYLDAPFTITQGNRTLNDFVRFRGEDVRFILPGNLTPHFPYNELPQPTVGPGGPLQALFGSPIGGVGSSDIPREPTSNDFPGQSFIFRSGELAVANFRSDLQGGDITYKRRVDDMGVFGDWKVDWLAGLRVLNTNERFTFFFADLWGFSRNPTDPVDPNIPFGGQSNDPLLGQTQGETQITIDRKLSQTVFGPQFGLDASYPFLNWFEFNCNCKGGFMANAATLRGRTFLQTGAVYSDYSKTNLLTSGVIEGQVGLSYLPHPNVRLQAGWEYLWMINVGTVVGNLSFDLARENRPNNKDSILYSGLYLGGEVKF